jgi:hypothetical protein
MPTCWSAPAARPGLRVRRRHARTVLQQVRPPAQAEQARQRTAQLRPAAGYAGANSTAVELGAGGSIDAAQCQQAQELVGARCCPKAGLTAQRRLLAATGRPHGRACY